VLTLLTRLIFRRLDNIVMVATRVVGGDYATEITVSSDDEVGQFELLFEQFRCVFVDVPSHLPELQAQAQVTPDSDPNRKARSASQA
jgi:hypothetical protein